jgi:Fe-S-cluster containining protein
MSEALRHAVMDASSRAYVREAVLRVYRDLQQDVDARQPLCAASGRCCNFDRYGHRLYVTTMELAMFVHQLAEINGTVPEITHPATCPLQQRKLCSVHAIRPFGCRIFFCDPTATQWQNEQYEQFHARLKRLHDELNVPYFYVEWRQALRALSALSLNPEP